MAKILTPCRGKEEKLGDVTARSRRQGRGDIINLALMLSPEQLLNCKYRKPRFEQAGGKAAAESARGYWLIDRQLSSIGIGGGRVLPGGKLNWASALDQTVTSIHFVGQPIYQPNSRRLT